MAVVQQVFRRTGSRRPVDKLLVSVNKDAVAAAKVNTELVTVTFPCTIVGLRWFLTINQDGGTGQCLGAWAIYVLRDGNIVPSLSFTDGSKFVDPEQQALAFGAWSIDNNTETKVFEGSTKTMRKLMGGDKLILIMQGVATETSKVFGIVQFFCKT